MSNPEKVNILIVDDQPRNLLSFETILAELGENLIMVRSGSEALNVLLRQDIAVILLDVNMAGMDGFETASLIRGNRRFVKTPIIFVTAFTTTDLEKLHGYELGAVDFIHVPINAVVLKSKISFFVELHRKNRELAALNGDLSQRIKMARLAANVGAALAEEGTLHKALQPCAAALVDDLGAALARIWTLNEAANVLELQASAGMYTHRDGPHARVSVGQFKIGLIAAERRPHLTNSIVDDPRVDDQDWARREGMVAFAGYPLLLSDRLVGVMAMFAREPLNDATLDALGAIGNGIAVGIARHRAMADLLQAKQEADRANRAKSEFLSRMSHELRTPLNSILGFGQRLLSSNLAARDQQRAEQVVKAGRHLLDLINEVLDLSRIEAGHTSISPEPISVANALGEALDLVRPLAQQHHIQFHQEPIPADWHVLADNQRLKQVLLNLLSNAVKYNRERGSVTVSCKDHAPGRLLLAVTDSGAGIAADKMDQLFEPFNRLGAEQRAIEGTGLGLAVSRRLVELMGGSINAVSEFGKGTTFSVDLARAVAPKPGALVSDSARASDPSAVRRTLLYIEDNLANVSLLEDILIDRPAVQLLTAMQGGLGLDLARQHHPDLILLDVHLPDIMGDEVLRRLQADPKLQGIPVVVLSADATARQMEILLSLGARDYLTKPLDVVRILAVFDRFLREERTQHEHS